MRWPSRKIAGLLVLTMSAAVPASFAQQLEDSMKATQVMGFGEVKSNTNGILKVENGNLQFSSSKGKTEMPIGSVEDVITGDDSQRVFRGTIGTLTMFTPYEGGRFLSLFRTKLDTLTLQYRDSNGALHGAIFTMAQGKADPFKKKLVGQGAHTSIPVQEETPGSNTKASAKKEQKP